MADVHIIVHNTGHQIAAVLYIDIVADIYRKWVSLIIANKVSLQYCVLSYFSILSHSNGVNITSGNATESEIAIGAHEDFADNGGIRGDVSWLWYLRDSGVQW